jgi:hypothetical protein
MVSAVGTTGGTSITMAGMRLEDFCEPPRVFTGTTLAESTTIFPGVNIVITAEVTFVRDPDQDLNDGDIIYHVADGEIVWTIEGTDSVGCSYNAPTVTVPIDPEGSSFLELDTTHDQVQYHGHGDVPDGPVVDVIVSCPDRSYTYGTGAEGTWFNAPEEEAFVMLGSSLTGSYQYQPSEAIGTLYQWNFTRAG